MSLTLISSPLLRVLTAAMIPFLILPAAYGQQSKFSVVHAFAGGTDGALPIGPLFVNQAGNVYGTTLLGGDLTSATCTSGSAGCGVIFHVTPAGAETVLYSLTGGADGDGTTSGVIQDSSGNLYGTTYSGGTTANGEIFKLDTTKTYSVLYNFTNGSDGGTPYAGLTRDTAGNLYGTASTGGNVSQNCPKYPPGCGVVFQLSPGGAETPLYSFTGGTTGSYPYWSLLRNSAGVLFGTASNTLYEVSTSGVETVLHTFSDNGRDGYILTSNVITDASGNLYGVTSSGGKKGQGIVYKVDQSGNETILYTFTGGSDGGSPIGTLAMDSTGNLYGTAYAGGISSGVCSSSCGVVFEVSATGTETVLHKFTGGTDGGSPSSGIFLNVSGTGVTTLYGTTRAGGNLTCTSGSTAGCGTVFKIVL